MTKVFYCSEVDLNKHPLSCDKIVEDGPYPSSSTSHSSHTSRTKRSTFNMLSFDRQATPPIPRDPDNKSRPLNWFLLPPVISRAEWAASQNVLREQIVALSLIFKGAVQRTYPVLGRPPNRLQASLLHRSVARAQPHGNMSLRRVMGLVAWHQMEALAIWANRRGTSIVQEKKLATRHYHWRSVVISDQSFAALLFALLVILGSPFRHKKPNIGP